jgi:hypothetical protein
MSDVSGGTGWWLASDGKWYPPEAGGGAPPQSAPERRVPAHRSRRPPTDRRWPRRVLLGSLAIIVVAAVVIIAVVATGGKKHKSAGTSLSHTPTTAATVGSPVPSVEATQPPATPPATASAGPGTTSPTATPTEESTAAAPPIALSGTGNSTPSFTAAGGLTVLSAQYGGPNTFSVGIVDDTGQTIDTPINTVAGYTGTVSEALTPGHYTLSVIATTAWSVTITQPRNQQAFKLPYVFSNGGGDALIGPFRADGPYQITATNRGSANFMLRVLDISGYERDIPINQIGPYSGSVAEADVTPGNYYLQVNSNGSWTINVSSL